MSQGGKIASLGQFPFSCHPSLAPINFGWRHLLHHLLSERDTAWILLNFPLTNQQGGFNKSQIVQKPIKAFYKTFFQGGIDNSPTEYEHK